MWRPRRARTLRRMNNTTMKTFIIEREIPGAAGLTHEELRGITSTSNDAVASLDKPYKWLHSYVAGDKVYCVHQAESADVIREHSSRGNFPANLVAEVTNVFDSTGPRDLPR
jgi:Protein of unknown function (DUF4242)